MHCPFCNHEDTQVKDSRPSEDGSSIRRRRYCPECESRFTTFERVQLRELTVVKSAGEKKPFDREKIMDWPVRAPLEKFLELNGFDVVSAETADGALDRLGEQAIDAAIVDLRLAQGSGREVIVSIPPPRPVIIFSAVPDESGRLEQMRPNTRLIQKPFSLLMLIETLQKMMAAAARKDPAATRISTRVN